MSCKISDKEIERLHGENKRLKHDLCLEHGRWVENLELQDQIAALMKENEKLTSENKELQKKCGCPCNKGIKSYKVKI